MKKAIRMGDLLCEDYLEKQLKNIVEWKNLTVVGGYKSQAVDYTKMLEWLNEYGNKLKPYITNVSAYLNKAANEGKRIMFEAQLGALRDIDFGIYPYTSSSSTIAAYGPIGAGIPGKKLDCVIGCLLYTSRCV